MDFLKNIIYSLEKSYKLAKLQKQIVQRWDNENSLELFFDLCEQDQEVLKCMQEYEITRSSLREIYHNLERSGAGQWIKGHYVALSTIAYRQALELYIRNKKQGISDIKISYILVEYWKHN